MAKKKTKIDKDLCRMITPEFRVSYPHVFKAQAPKPNDTPKYSITMLFPKDQDLMGLAPDGTTKRSLKRIIKNAKVAEWGEDKEEWPDEIESPVNDGDSKKHAEKDGYEGHWAIKATSSEDQRPTVVGPDMTELTQTADLYPGCYARAFVFARVWEYMGKTGVHFIVDHVQKLRDGKPFGGKIPVDQVFSPVESEEDGGDGEDGEDF